MMSLLSCLLLSFSNAWTVEVLHFFQLLNYAVLYILFL